MKYSIYLIKYHDTVMYVGKTNNFYKRKWQHLNCIGDKNHMYSAIPTDADLQYIDIQVISEFDNNGDALKCENDLILQYDTINNGWNKNRSGYVSNDTKAYYKKRNQKLERKEWVYKYCKTDKYKEYHRIYMRERRKRLKESMLN